MSKKFSSLNKFFRSKRIKIFWFISLALTPLSLKAPDITVSNKFNAQGLNKKSHSRKKNNFNDSHSTKASEKNRKIALIQPSSINSLSCSSLNPKLNDHDELTFNQKKSKYLYQHKYINKISNYLHKGQENRNFQCADFILWKSKNPAKAKRKKDILRKLLPALPAGDIFPVA